ncbi:MAG: PAS domain S-box protein [Desulfobacterales bacterium]|jgi:histidine kinase|nr:PAS domain S-box protein [Desulfobacterales bacterium]
MMQPVIQYIRRRLAAKLILMVGGTLFVIIFAWSHFNIQYQREKLMENVLHTADWLTDTIKLGAHSAMMQNSRDDINQMINNIARQQEFESIRIYNKGGQIKFSNVAEEVDRTTNIKDEACYICHRTEPPLTVVNLAGRTRIFSSPKGYRVLGIISPIDNEPECATSACHVHPGDKKILGALDVVISLDQTDIEIAHAENWAKGLALIVFLVTGAIIFLFLMRFVNQPAKKLIDGTRRIAEGRYAVGIDIHQDDEMGQLGHAINHMGNEIAKHQAKLNKQRDEYQKLFEMVPCLITVQDRQYRLLNYNKAFGLKFAPKPGDYCYRAYKGRQEKCVPCAVEQTFLTGISQSATETGVDKDGTAKHWITRTTPITDDNGKIVAAMEISLDISDQKQLEMALDKSEKKYHAIFNNIPNPVFVLSMDSLKIIDCNKSVEAVYGYTEKEILGVSFLTLFPAADREAISLRIYASEAIDRVKNIHKAGTPLIVNIRISPSEYSGQKVFLVTSSDITKRLEVEQQLIQAGKMATLGEMATGIAHELNQPLSVIKTVSSFCMDKLEKQETIAPEILATMLTKTDKNVDRATRIITHMRQFARKSEMKMEKVQINEVIRNAVDIFSQQLKVKGIKLVCDTEKVVPKILADPDRLEQVFINLLVNARDAIEEKWALQGRPPEEESQITIFTRVANGKVTVDVRDTGMGIPPPILEKIFEPFFTTKEVGKGTGLGLSISYGIVKECGGSITAYSGPEGGARFTLAFPFAMQRKKERGPA